MNVLKVFVGFIGRALLSIIFISSAVHQLIDWHGTMNYMTHAMTDWLMQSAGYDFLHHLFDWGLSNAAFLLAIAVIFELIGGLLVFIGLWTRVGALLLILFLIPTTLIFHHFWQLQGPDRMMQMINFMKNVSILGGLFIVLAFGKGCTCDHEHSAKKD